MTRITGHTRPTHPNIVVVRHPSDDWATTTPLVDIPDAHISYDATRQNLPGADIIVLTSTAPITDWVHHTVTSRFEECVERHLAGGRPVLALGAAALALIDEDTDAPWVQWPGRRVALAASNNAGTDAAAGHDAVGTDVIHADANSPLLAGLDAPATITPAPEAAITHWLWRSENELMASPVASFGASGLLRCVENGPLTALLADPRQATTTTLATTWLRRHTELSTR